MQGGASEAYSIASRWHTQSVKKASRTSATRAVAYLTDLDLLGLQQAVQPLHIQFFNQSIKVPVNMGAGSPLLTNNYKKKKVSKLTQTQFPLEKSTY